MPIFNKKNLLTELIDRTELISSNTKVFFKLNNEQLNQRPSQDKWSITEIFEHLNITNQIYLDFILIKITKAVDVINPFFKSGWMGDLVYDKIMPKSDGSVFKMKTPRSLRPDANAMDGSEVLNRFLLHQDTIHDILGYASTKDLERIKIPFAFSKNLKLRLGDNLRFLIAHNERHLLQAQRILPDVEEKITLQ